MVKAIENAKRIAFQGEPGAGSDSQASAAKPSGCATQKRGQ